ncbi:cardiolipin synthase [Moritella viscosa]|uniref:Cardiolipin synthase A n=1 Tax=Moritella viscosa TaxID=80854 RepID=A0A1L0AMJ1_9GAMM|nr:cardiolipin synthase [Moritella viscosa]SGY88974.1 Putative cardiolipin synthase [Moritella viscosa]SGY92549.1 Putative cardiolipin synthase [Moritella viscosa]SGY96552.1 Putative cardiolipin synthase [Moritella viscosa]SGY96659.1 Putative cardiolipin synthase [Moritella viscosa]SHO07187.1 Putative cardiolipin synthase [Moritella viscosa]
MYSWDSFTNFITLLLVFLHAVIIILVSFRVITKRRSASISLAWLAVIYTLPFAGVIVYVIFGELYLGKKRVQRAEAMLGPFTQRINQCAAPYRVKNGSNTSVLVTPLRELIYSRFQMPSVTGNQLTLLTSPHCILEQITTDINSAVNAVYLEFYIWAVGGKADLVALALINAAKRGVDCRVMLDSVGSSEFFKSHWPKCFKQAGIHLVEVLPVGPMRIFFHRQDLRMHRKLIAIDSHVGYTGSMNLIDPQVFKQNAGVGEWVDIMIRMQGPIIPITGSLLEWDWEMETGESLVHTTISQYKESVVFEENSQVQVIPSGPYFDDDNIHQVLVSAIYLAQKSLILTTPYFVPDEALQAALKTASARGVKVQIILPAKNDSRMVDYACKGFFDELLACGVEIYQYQDGLLHTKSILVDNELCLVGTVNLDKRSFWLNFEVTLLIDQSPFIAELYQLQLSYIAHSHKVCLTEWRQRSRVQRFLESLFYLFNPLL